MSNLTPQHMGWGGGKPVDLLFFSFSLTNQGFGLNYLAQISNS